MKSPDEQALAAELRALRPTPRPEFAAELDTRAAAGFPRRGPGLALTRFAERFRVSPRRLALPAGGLALATIAIATVVIVGSEGDAGQQTLALEGQARQESGDASQATGKPADHGPVQFEAEVPSISAPHASSQASGAGMSAAPEAEELRFEAAKVPTGPYASHANHRDVERSAEMVLGTEATDVRRVASKVFTAVHTYDGIVLQSSIEDGSEGEAGASFELLIPSGKLGDALAAFSAIAEVRSRHESTADVTAKTVGLGERLQDSQATISGLLAQLADADTDGERAAAEAELHNERLRATALRANLADLQRRANLSQVSLKIESGEAGAPPADENGSWGVGDALADAGHILEVAAGVALIGLAILAPFALIALLAWLARRNGIRRARERALG